MTTVKHMSDSDLRSAQYSINTMAEYLLAQKGALAVQLFGSYARGQATWSGSYPRQSSDCDLIVVADYRTASAWMSHIEYPDWPDRPAPFDEDIYIAGATSRKTAFEKFFQFLWPDTNEFYDVFVFPPNWQSDFMLDKLQEMGRHNDPSFMRNIARDVITYDPLKQSFPWP